MAVVVQGVLIVTPARTAGIVVIVILEEIAQYVIRISTMVSLNLSRQRRQPPLIKRLLLKNPTRHEKDNTSISYRNNGAGVRKGNIYSTEYRQ
jgi:hypothetical protein